MKTLHHLNILLYLATLIAYVGLETGVGSVFQFFLGILQLVFFLICLAQKSKESIKQHLGNYATYVGLMILISVVLLIGQPFSDKIIRAIFIAVPMLIATYFVYITHLIQKQ